jgi:quinol monooxygenase YgiN
MMGLPEPRQRLALAPQTSSVCAVLKAETKPGADGDFALLISDLAHHVRNEEPGCQSYVVTRAMGSPRHFAIHTRFDDWQAFEAHADTQHMAKLMPRLNALLAAPLAMEIFLEV